MTSSSPGISIFIVGLSQRSGKTTAGEMLARILGTTRTSTSDIISANVEATHGLAPGSITMERERHPEHWRAELIVEGNRMADEGRPAAVVALERGHHIVDGIRRAAEVSFALDAATRRFGRRPYLFCINKHDAPAVNDNTEPEALLAMSDVLIQNNGSLVALEKKLRTLVDLIRAGAPLPREI